MSDSQKVFVGFLGLVGAMLVPPLRLAALTTLIYFFVPFPGSPSIFLSLALAISGSLVFGALRDSAKTVLHGE